MTQSLKCDIRHVVFFMKRTDFILDVGKITFFLSTIDEPHDRVTHLKLLSWVSVSYQQTMDTTIKNHAQHIQT